MNILKFTYYIFFSKSYKSKKIKNDLLYKHTFSFPESSKSDFLLPIRQFKRILLKIWNGTKQEKIVFLKQQESLIYCDTNLEKNDLIKYVRNYDKSVEFAICREDLLVGFSFSKKLFFSILYLFLFIPVFLIVFFRRKLILNLTLLPEIYLQIKEFLRLVNNLNIYNLYFFHPHEPEANLIAFFIMKNGVNVIKIPNSNPLFMFNKSMVSSKLVLSLGYQKEEADFFYNLDDGLMYEYWEPKYLQKFYNNNFENSINNKICFYSHGAKIRKEMGHNLPAFNEVNMEIDLLDFIRKNNFFSTHDVTVCLHPKEKQSLEIISESKEYYKEIFGESVKFFDEISYHSFSKFNLGFGAFSSILFERIHCGYKTLIFNDRIKDFPIINSNFDYFLVKKLNDIENKIDSALLINSNNFFLGRFNYTFKFQSHIVKN